MRIANVLMYRVRVGSRDHIHSEIAAAFHHLTKGIPVAEPFAAIVHRNLSWIERDASSGAQASSIGVNPAEIVKPEIWIVISRIVFYKGHLRPTHRPVIPSGLCGRLTLGPCPCA